MQPFDSQQWHPDYHSALRKGAFQAAILIQTVSTLRNRENKKAVFLSALKLKNKNIFEIYK